MLHIKKIVNLFRKNPYLSNAAWDYQKAIVAPRIKPNDIVLDIGSGNYPSPRANILADLYQEKTIHRSGPIKEDKPLVICPVERLPFLGHAFDFIICSHVLEHVDSPLTDGHELARVGEAGYIETPAYGKDIIVGSGYMHQWQVVEFEGTLHFFEYSQQQKEAHVNSPVMDLWVSKRYHPWQDFFWQRQIFFNAMLAWQGQPKIIEHRRPQPRLKESELNKRPTELKLPDEKCSLTPDEIALLEKRLATPDGDKPMYFKRENSCFVDTDNRFLYPIRGKRIYTLSAD